MPRLLGAETVVLVLAACVPCACTRSMDRKRFRYCVLAMLAVLTRTAEGAAPGPMAPPSAAIASLQVVAWYPDDNLGPSAALFIRGNFSTLSWDIGAAMQHVGQGQWLAILPVSANESSAL
jgi:hypothetical protein